METGIDRLAKKYGPDLRNQRIGLLIHPASVDYRLHSTLDIILKDLSCQIVRIFGPEHGFAGTAQDMDSIGSSVDWRTGIPVTSLYGATEDSLKPSAEEITEIDTLVCDLKDVGSRYYTFIYTMAFCMRACAAQGKKVIVLDRPNPINGLDVEGQIPKPAFKSFVGMYPIPQRHGMTIGELARLFNDADGMGCNLEIIPMNGWEREWYFDQTGLPWVYPSPNIPTLETAIVYPGMCLIEATEISEGRGTTRPFELVGAPFIDAHALAGELNRIGLAGVHFRPVSFKPTFHKWEGEECGGVQVHVVDRKTFKPYLTGVAVLKAIHDLYPNQFKWREKPYEFVTHIPAIDLLTGDGQLRLAIEKGVCLEDMERRWSGDAEKFQGLRKKYLLYD